MYRLSKKQREELRRLTQKVNRRILQAEKIYRKEGRRILPQEVVGKYQTREQWELPSRPLSRSVQFRSKEEYLERIRFLRSFEGKAARPTMTEFTKYQREKVKEAVKTSLGVDIPKKLEKKLAKMSAPQLSKFWEQYSENAVRAGVQYSSEAVMSETLAEFFSEDIDALVGF